jgi:hypothetical protein
LRIANKILEEKSNKFGTKQGKHEEHPVSFAGKDSFIRKKSKIRTKKARMQLCANRF